ncbi:hypothetical protein ACLOJK_023793 [Asimina triloba]
MGMLLLPPQPPLGLFIKSGNGKLHGEGDCAQIDPKNHSSMPSIINRLSSSSSISCDDLSRSPSTFLGRSAGSGPNRSVDAMMKEDFAMECFLERLFLVEFRSLFGPSFRLGRSSSVLREENELDCLEKIQALAWGFRCGLDSFVSLFVCGLDTARRPLFLFIYADRRRHLVVWSPSRSDDGERPRKIRRPRAPIEREHKIPKSAFPFYLPQATSSTTMCLWPPFRRDPFNPKGKNTKIPPPSVSAAPSLFFCLGPSKSSLRGLFFDI